MLPNLKALSLQAAEPANHERAHEVATSGLNGVGLGRRLPSDTFDRGQARIERLRHDHVVHMLNKDGSNASPDELRHHWQYLYGRYRDESNVPSSKTEEYAKLPDYVKTALEKNQEPYTDVKKQTTVVQGAPLHEPAYHAEITFASPDVYEMEAHAYHWWLLQAVAHNYHGIDLDVQEELYNLVQDAAYFTHGEGLAKKVHDDYVAAQQRGAAPAPPEGIDRAFVGQPSPAAWYHYLGDRATAQSLHVGHSSYHGIALYWRLEGEVYDYLSKPQLDGRSTVFGGAEKMRAPWILEVVPDANTAAITPRQLFEHLLWYKVLKPLHADMSCIQSVDKTNSFVEALGTTLVDYRVKYDLPPDLEKYGPSCDDRWPNWKVAGKED